MHGCISSVNKYLNVYLVHFHAFKHAYTTEITHGKKTLKLTIEQGLQKVMKWNKQHVYKILVQYLHERKFQKRSTDIKPWM